MFWKTLTKLLGRTRGPLPNREPQATDPLVELEQHFEAARELYRELCYRGPQPEPRARPPVRSRLRHWPVGLAAGGVVAAALFLAVMLLSPARRVDDGLDARVAATERPLVWKPKGRMTRPGPLLARPTAALTGHPTGFRLPRRPQPVTSAERSDRG